MNDTIQARLDDLERTLKAGAFLQNQAARSLTCAEQIRAREAITLEITGHTLLVKTPETEHRLSLNGSGSFSGVPRVDGGAAVEPLQVLLGVVEGALRADCAAKLAILEEANPAAIEAGARAAGMFVGLSKAFLPDAEELVAQSIEEDSRERPGEVLVGLVQRAVRHLCAERGDWIRQFHVRAEAGSSVPTVQITLSDVGVEALWRALHRIGAVADGAIAGLQIAPSLWVTYLGSVASPAIVYVEPEMRPVALLLRQGGMLGRIDRLSFLSPSVAEDLAALPAWDPHPVADEPAAVLEKVDPRAAALASLEVLGQAWDEWIERSGGGPWQGSVDAPIEARARLTEDEAEVVADALRALEEADDRAMAQVSDHLWVVRMDPDAFGARFPAILYAAPGRAPVGMRIRFFTATSIRADEEPPAVIDQVWLRPDTSFEEMAALPEWAAEVRIGHDAPTRSLLNLCDEWRSWLMLEFKDRRWVRGPNPPLRHRAELTAEEMAVVLAAAERADTAIYGDEVAWPIADRLKGIWLAHLLPNVRRPALVFEVPGSAPLLLVLGPVPAEGKLLDMTRGWQIEEAHILVGLGPNARALTDRVASALNRSDR